MKLSEFDYYLPQERIAQYPLRRRDSSRLLVLDRNTGNICHHRFPDILDYLRKGDCLVLNDTRVVPARLIGQKERSSGKVELFLLEKQKDGIFRSLVKPARRIKKGERIIFGQGKLIAEVIDDPAIANGIRTVRFSCSHNLETALKRIGQVPLPPYIKRKPETLDKRRYQTVYAQKEGSIAAPTAGLHFTRRLLERVRLKGINIAYITLNVGYATFKPISGECVTRHRMEAEHFEVSSSAVKILNATRMSGGRIVCVGTTACRTLETVAKSLSSSQLCARQGKTNLFIYPPYEFKLTTGLLTNFHLPRTTLLMLVSAFGNRKNLFRAYEEAVKRKYRFYSYGDAMLII